ncbi:hypothetical protein L596_011364 [Steinernema carpocapsae]|uniref:Phospholipase A2 domain-containing protein n=1 Tax=Steinernema carpocapsae TaxID=34508 RepID=A0A4V6A4G6_STECR|nr:hypothetical protein L596_011364 [Steinernema carpocapsae]
MKIVFVLLGFCAASFAVLPPLQQFHCGSTDVQKIVAWKTLDLQCSEHGAYANRCCQEHDRCYTEQRGQTICDDAFCDCLNSTLTSENCSSVTVQFCSAVKLFGDTYYVKAAL